LEKSYKWTNIMYIPALILLILFIVYPFVSGFKIAFTNWNGYSQHYKYVGLSNFKAMFQDKNVWTSLINTLIYGFGSTFFQQVLGLAYALLLNKAFRGRNLARTAIYLPVLISAVIMGYMWYFILRFDNGALNDVLKLLGFQPKLWLSQPKLAVAMMVTINVIQYVGVSMVIYLAGLQGIPAMYYEASEIDSASAWEQFKYITFPLLYPSIVTSVTLNLIGGLKLFDVIKALTAGGPGYSTHSLSTLINTTYFQTQSAGYASAIGILLFIAILIPTMIIQAFFKRREVEY
jgi:raffinose/stachyose/melibiose transport system permease protein